MLASAYPRFSLTDETVATYCLLLEDIPAAELKAAALQCAAGRDFFPSVHELRQAVTDLRRHAAGVPNAIEAWSDLVQSSRSAGGRVVEESGQFYIEHSEYQFIHPIVPHVAGLLGWPDRFPGGPDDLVADRAHFFRAYDQMLAKYLEESARLPEIQQFIDAGVSNPLLTAGVNQLRNQWTIKPQ